VNHPFPGPEANDELHGERSELRPLLHQLNNQLGIVLAHAEMLEAKASDDVNRARATQVVVSVLEAMGTAKQIRQRSDTIAL